MGETGSDDMATLAADIRTDAGRLLAIGYENDEQVCESVLFFMDLHYCRRVEGAWPLVRRIVAEMADQRRRDQASWPTPTDCERLDAAFAALRRKGIAARQHFELDRAGGYKAMEELVASRPGRLRGYTFFTWQDTDGAVEDGELCLPFGSTSGGGEADAQVGHEIVAALREAGLAPEWDGDPGLCVSVPVTWLRRRPEAMKRHKLHADYR